MRQYFQILLITILSYSAIFLLAVAVVDANTTTDTEELHPSTKRIAVLSFEDNSNFDSSTGCGCVPNFIGRIFSTKKKWNLETGFATILNRRLAETTIYQPVTRDELLEAMAQMTLSPDSLKKLNKEQRAQFAKLVNADVIVMGDIRDFAPSTRMRANASRTLREGGREANNMSASYRTGFAVMGYIYKAIVKLNAKFYDASGNEIATIPINVKHYHRLAGTQVSGLEASITESGTHLRFGQMSEQHGKNVRPIVKPTELDKIKKMTAPEFDRTLIGKVTNEALIKVVLAIRDNYGPNFITPWEVNPENTEEKRKVDEEALKRPIKVTYVDSENANMIYINAGSARNLAIGQQFAVFTRGEPIRDIDTGEILDYAPKRIATVAVNEIRNDRLSVVKVIEQEGELKRGDMLKTIPKEEIAKEE
ncbi:hypothetical protein F4X73_08055 [Candidatus Poribacteria bacterium]|nr:hypothetical protein [Candidatus Poribacteria bacterium]MYF57292.1 hypothetical protein [Candidatus Poribacteria bacterium]